ncbi:hypothetical protein IHE45_17G011700 [Dioscorea alata]|uniref:Uncharacterized protein n=1 Tax=Dioscorea alata TaxID=55571 RepID=A0ACB7UAF8_DIOAL|nr:hypothetical protein IHE45_17G011700 [Dioscorea alata]
MNAWFTSQPCLGFESVRVIAGDAEGFSCRNASRCADLDLRSQGKRRLQKPVADYYCLVLLQLILFVLLLVKLRLSCFIN